MRPRIAVDIDDVLSNYAVEFLAWAEPRGVGIKNGDVHGSFLEMGVPLELIDEFQSDHLETLGLVSGAQEAIKQLSEKFEIFCITSRSIVWGVETGDWLSKYFPEVKWTSFSRDKGDICRKYGAVYLIEDQIQYGKQFTPTLMLAQPWNTEWEGLRGRWEDIVGKILY